VRGGGEGGLGVGGWGVGGGRWGVSFRCIRADRYTVLPTIDMRGGRVEGIILKIIT
jgi:hypothetical protein